MNNEKPAQYNGFEGENIMTIKFDVPEELANKALEAIELTRNTGKLKKGTNEVTKIIERGTAKLVVIAEDITPKEIIMHLPLLCEEKNAPYIFVKKQKELGAACGIGVACAAVVIIDPGKSSGLIADVVEKVNALKN